jgi:DnaJ domain
VAVAGIADPYRVLGVARTASRDEIAHAYRRLAKLHHPDAGAAPSPEMGRVNEAWHVLSDPARRTRWDREHTILEPMPYAAPVTQPTAGTRPPVPAAPPSRFDSGWIAAAVVAGTAVLVGLVMIGVSVAAQPGDERVRVETEAMTFLHDPRWTGVVGDGDDPPGQRVIAHLTTWETDPADLCTTYGETCGFDTAEIPPGEATILVTEHTEGTPPVPEPVVQLPGGADADAIIGGRPAAYTQTALENDLTLVWWQLSPPGFPDRWIEIRALIRGFTGPLTGAQDEIMDMIGTIEFDD